MKKGEILEGTVDGLDFPNKGVLWIEGEKVTVKNALPGQRIRLAINKKRGGKAEGRLLEVLEPSPLERRSDICDICPHFGSCGGCLYQSLPYEEQLKLKERQVDKLIRPVCGDWGFEGIKASPLVDGYRNKMEFSFGDEYKGGPLALGMHRRGSFYDVVTTRDCRIVHPDFCRILGATLDYFIAMEVPYYKKLQHVGYLRHLLVRRAVKTGEILVALVTTTQLGWQEKPGQVLPPEEGSIQDPAEPIGMRGSGGLQAASPLREQEKSISEEELLDGWKQILEGLDLSGSLAGILHIKNDSLADTVQSDGTKVLFGREYFYEELLGMKFRITPFSFFQTNSLGAEVLYETVREYVGDTKDKVVFDLYSGTGTIAQIASPVAARVVGVEIVEEAVEAARENARRNGLDNCEFIVGDVLKAVGEIADKPDLIILDPPRDGIHPKALQKIIGFGVETLVYVSCKPTSLARDLAVFLENGYRVERGCCVDMFPGTANVESIVLLSKLHTKQNIEVELEMSELDLTAAESKATYEEIKGYVLEHMGLKVSSLYIAQVKQKCGIIERENYNLPKSENSRQPKCPPEKEKAIRDALEYFKMV
ncbi:class I SAM-dependent RNA methyltransferase [Clostridiaceae bacterium]|nr:class I SAM-dependent RNA methyltransferase [Clostridiaceae bacterium]RKI08804.1 class I SAM-dependent RNA methyltransferase [bacterium 1XD21-70]